MCIRGLHFSQYKQEHSFCSDVRSILLNSQLSEKEAFFTLAQGVEGPDIPETLLRKIGYYNWEGRMDTSTSGQDIGTKNNVLL